MVDSVIRQDKQKQTRYIPGKHHKPVIQITIDGNTYGCKKGQKDAVAEQENAQGNHIANMLAFKFMVDHSLPVIRIRMNRDRADIFLAVGAYHKRPNPLYNLKGVCYAVAVM